MLYGQAQRLLASNQGELSAANDGVYVKVRDIKRLLDLSLVDMQPFPRRHFAEWQ